MLLLIIRKEILDNLLNARFAVASLLSVILIVCSSILLAGNYQAALRDYEQRTRSQDDFIDQYGHANRASWMSRPMRAPSRFQALVLGIDREAGQQNFINNPVPALLPGFDFTTIVTIIMSLMAILFSYDAISGEREAGLLRLMLSAGASRASILLGKFLGGIISLLVPFTVGALGGVLSLAASDSRLRLDGQDFGVLAILLGASYLYISSMVALGLLFSSRSESSAASALKTLFAWVLLVLAIPNVSPFLAATLYRIPSAAKIEKETYRLRETERDEILRIRGAELLKTRFPDVRSAIEGNSSAEFRQKLAGDPALKNRYALYAGEFDDLARQVNREQRDRAQKVSADFQERSDRQRRLATMLASASPFSNFVFIATDATETGIQGEAHWREQADRFDGILSRYVDSRYDQEKKENPDLQYNDYLNLRDRPRFQYSPQGLGERVAAILPHAGLLLMFALAFLGAAFKGFLRYDVR